MTYGRQIPPAWYPDPERQGGQRWWDGAAWSEHRLAPFVPVVPPMPLRTERTPAQRRKRRAIVGGILGAAVVAGVLVVALRPRPAFTVHTTDCESILRVTGVERGTVTNNTSVAHTYVVTTHWLDSSFTNIGFGSAVVTVGPHASTAFEMSAILSAPMHGCAEAKAVVQS